MVLLDVNYFWQVWRHECWWGIHTKALILVIKMSFRKEVHQQLILLIADTRCTLPYQQTIYFHNNCTTASKRYSFRCVPTPSMLASKINFLMCAYSLFQQTQLWRQHVVNSALHRNTPLLPDRMWVRKLSHAQPCSKTVLFISSVTLLCNAAVCMCTVGGGGPTGGQDFCWLCGPLLCAFLVFVSAEASRRHRNASPADKVTGRNSASRGRRCYKHQLMHLPFTLCLQQQQQPDNNINNIDLKCILVKKENVNVQTRVTVNFILLSAEESELNGATLSDMLVIQTLRLSYIQADRPCFKRVTVIWLYIICPLAQCKSFLSLNVIWMRVKSKNTNTPHAEVNTLGRSDSETNRWNQILRVQ